VRLVVRVVVLSRFRLRYSNLNCVTLLEVDAIVNLS
jgi:hypothetical protein